MPRKVDHDERRRHIVEALLHIAGTQGLSAVTLRQVAQQAEISMGSVQHYFPTKEDMLAFALRHWLSFSVHERFTARVRARVSRNAAGTGPAAILLALATEYLPYDEPSRFDARLAAAFVAQAAVEPALATALAPAYTAFADTLQAALLSAKPDLDAPIEAQRFAALLDGLRMPVLIGALPQHQALSIVEMHLDQLLTQPTDHASRVAQDL